MKELFELLNEYPLTSFFCFIALITLIEHIKS